jgi:hypothetical protein
MVLGQVHTANLDSFWALLRGGIIGTYHNVSKKYFCGTVPAPSRPPLGVERLDGCFVEVCSTCRDLASPRFFGLV